jgi:zinc protease
MRRLPLLAILLGCALAARAADGPQKVGRTGDAAIAGQIVSNLYLGRTFAWTAEQEKRIEALTPEAVRDAFQKHVDPKKLVIIRAGDIPK